MLKQSKLRYDFFVLHENNDEKTIDKATLNSRALVGAYSPPGHQIQSIMFGSVDDRPTCFQKIVECKVDHQQDPNNTFDICVDLY